MKPSKKAFDEVKEDIIDAFQGCIENSIGYGYTSDVEEDAIWLLVDSYSYAMFLQHDAVVCEFQDSTDEWSKEAYTQARDAIFNPRQMVEDFEKIWFTEGKEQEISKYWLADLFSPARAVFTQIEAERAEHAVPIIIFDPHLCNWQILPVDILEACYAYFVNNVNQKLDTHFTLELGQGGFGSVYMSWNAPNDEKERLKEYLKIFEGDCDWWEVVVADMPAEYEEVLSANNTLENADIADWESTADYRETLDWALGLGGCKPMTDEQFAKWC